METKWENLSSQFEKAFFLYFCTAHEIPRTMKTVHKMSAFSLRTVFNLSGSSGTSHDSLRGTPTLELVPLSIPSGFLQTVLGMPWRRYTIPAVLAQRSESPEALTGAVLYTADARWFVVYAVPCWGASLHLEHKITIVWIGNVVIGVRGGERFRHRSLIGGEEGIAVSDSTKQLPSGSHLSLT